jgi:hypothetical protein
VNTAKNRWHGVKHGKKIGMKLNTAPTGVGQKLNENEINHMDSPFAKKPTAMELENLIYEVSLNRALILILLSELEKTNPDLTTRVQEALNHEPQRVFGLVSQFVEEPSPYYEPFLKIREENCNADSALEKLKAIIHTPPNQQGTKEVGE